MSETTPRQVLYALVAAGFLLVVAVLVVGAAVAGLVPVWWTVITALAVIAGSAWTALSWRRTAPVLAAAIGLLIIWAIGTLLLVP